MNQISKNYAIALYELGISRESVEEAKLICREKALMEALKSPVVSKKEKHAVIEKVFPKEMHNFMKLNSDYSSVTLLEEIFTAYDEILLKEQSKMMVEIICVEPPAKEQEDRLKQFISREYDVENVEFEIKTDKELIGGFILRTYDKEYDYSIKGKIDKLAAHLKNI